MPVAAGNGSAADAMDAQVLTVVDLVIVTAEAELHVAVLLEEVLQHGSILVHAIVGDKPAFGGGKRLGRILEEARRTQWFAR